ncbi:hypothetical protein ABGB07_43070 [Micromonosporaceae bacterium B7E4]
MSDEPTSSDQAQRPNVQLRLAFLAAGAALAGALIGAAAAFGGTIYQAQSERDLALRQERQIAYTEMNLGFTRFMAAEQKDLCPRFEDLQPPLATIRLIGSGNVALHADFAVQAARRQCLATQSGKAPNPDDVKGLRDSVIAFTVAAQQDLVR